MSHIIPVFITSESFRFSPLKCRKVGVSLQAAKFLRWLYLEPNRTNAQISATFGLSLAFSMVDAGYVSNPLVESEPVNTDLWSLTDKGMEVLMQLTGVK
jgi:hypothetical protein